MSDETPTERPRASVMTEVMCSCRHDPETGSTTVEDLCRRHGTEANRHPYWRAPSAAETKPPESGLHGYMNSPLVFTAPVERERERERLLAEAGTIISGDRESDYGSAADGFNRTGRLWAAILDVETITAEQVALCLAALKISRLAQNTGHRDSWLDLIGYAALGGDIAADNAETD